MSRTALVSRMSSGLAHNVQVRVLVVEDHVALANRIGEGLRDAGFAVDVVYDGAAALESTTTTDYDVVVLDRDLPAVHGDRVCRALVRDARRCFLVLPRTPPGRSLPPGARIRSTSPRTGSYARQRRKYRL